jgi:ATP-dependent Lon protease
VTVIAPEDERMGRHEIPAHVVNGMTVVFVERIDQFFATTLVEIE